MNVELGVRYVSVVVVLKTIGRAYVHVTAIPANQIVKQEQDGVVIARPTANLQKLFPRQLCQFKWDSTHLVFVKKGNRTVGG